MTRTFDELVDHFISQVRQMKIKELDKMALIGMITMIQTEHEMQKHGKWVTDEDGCLCCSLCGNPCEINCINGKFIQSSYCSECGALMQECEVNEDV